MKRKTQNEELTNQTQKWQIKNNENKKTKMGVETNLCCELARLGGGIGVDRFVIVPLEE